MFLPKRGSFSICFACLITAILALAMLVPALSAADDVGPPALLLWPEGAPGAQGTEESDIPTLRIYPAEGETITQTAVVICPGGGYGVLAYDHEGAQVARWFARHGITGAVVRYRHAPKYRHPTPLGDAQRAIRYLRANASELKLDPQRIGVMGFSAGGHLASTVSTHFDAGKADATDPIDRQSSRPDFSVLCYPVISFKSDFGHKGSVKNLLGDNPDPALIENLSNETQVTKETPPTFLFHTTEDTGVPPQNSLVYYRACVEHSVPAELHIYQHGPHGVGLAPADPVLGTWTERLFDWLKKNGLLARQERAAVSGKVQLKGQPLRWGMIAFHPVTAGAARAEVMPTAVAMVANGGYAIAAGGGPMVGPHQVVVTNFGAVVPYPTIEDAYSVNQWTPQTSPLATEIKAGMNHFDINLD